MSWSSTSTFNGGTFSGLRAGVLSTHRLQQDAPGISLASLETVAVYIISPFTNVSGEHPILAAPAGAPTVTNVQMREQNVSPRRLFLLVRTAEAKHRTIVFVFCI